VGGREGGREGEGDQERTRVRLVGVLFCLAVSCDLSWRLEGEGGCPSLSIVRMGLPRILLGLF
jgi:hypothetical protein